MENGHKRQVALQRRAETNIKAKYFQKEMTLKSGLTSQVTGFTVHAEIFWQCNRQRRKIMVGFVFSFFYYFSNTGINYFTPMPLVMTYFKENGISTQEHSWLIVYVCLIWCQSWPFLPCLTYRRCEKAKHRWDSWRTDGTRKFELHHPKSQRLKTRNMRLTQTDYTAEKLHRSNSN